MFDTSYTISGGVSGELINEFTSFVTNLQQLSHNKFFSLLFVSKAFHHRTYIYALAFSLHIYICDVRTYWTLGYDYHYVLLTHLMICDF